MSDVIECVEAIMAKAKAFGADAVSYVETQDIRFDASFRQICESKTCGKYGSNWMCPPHVGEIEDLMAKAKAFDKAIIFQTITALEDSFDVEGMYGAGKRNNDLARKLKQNDCVKQLGQVLVLGSGACGYCQVCALENQQDCPFDESCIASIEAYGIDAMSLASVSGLKYMNGQNTVTYYGVLLFKGN